VGKKKRVAGQSSIKQMRLVGLSKEDYGMDKYWVLADKKLLK